MAAKAAGSIKCTVTVIAEPIEACYATKHDAFRKCSTHPTSFALPQVILGMPVTIFIVSHFRGAVQHCHRNRVIESHGFRETIDTVFAERALERFSAQRILSCVEYESVHQERWPGRLQERWPPQKIETTV